MDDLKKEEDNFVTTQQEETTDVTSLKREFMKFQKNNIESLLTSSYDSNKIASYFENFKRIKRNFIFQNFIDKEIEKDFANDFYGENSMQLRISLILISLIMAVFIPIDFYEVYSNGVCESIIINPVLRWIFHGWRFAIVGFSFFTSFLVQFPFIYKNKDILDLVILICTSGIGVGMTTLAVINQSTSAIVTATVVIFNSLMTRCLIHVAWVIVVVISFLEASIFQTIFLKLSWSDFANNAVVIFVILIAGLLLVFFREKIARDNFLRKKHIQILENEIKKESKREKKILCNIIPTHFIPLVKKARTFFKKYENLCFVVTDLVEFTKFSSTVSSNDLIRILNVVYSSFEVISKTWNMEEIKTVGDSYECLTLPRPQSEDEEFGGLGGISNDNVSNLEMESNNKYSYAESGCICAYNILKEFLTICESLSIHLKIRIGVSCGNAFVGVIGYKKLMMEVFGQGIERAHEMEKACTPNFVHVSSDIIAFLSSNQNFFFDEKQNLIEIPPECDTQSNSLIIKRENSFDDENYDYDDIFNKNIKKSKNNNNNSNNKNKNKNFRKRKSSASSGTASKKDSGVFSFKKILGGIFEKNQKNKVEPINKIISKKINKNNKILEEDDEDIIYLEEIVHENMLYDTKGDEESLSDESTNVSPQNSRTPSRNESKSSNENLNSNNNSNKNKSLKIKKVDSVPKIDFCFLMLRKPLSEYFFNNYNNNNQKKSYSFKRKVKEMFEMNKNLEKESWKFVRISQILSCFLVVLSFIVIITSFVMMVGFDMLMISLIAISAVSFVAFVFFLMFFKIKNAYLIGLISSWTQYLIVTVFFVVLLLISCVLTASDPLFKNEIDKNVFLNNAVIILPFLLLMFPNLNPLTKTIITFCISVAAIICLQICPYCSGDLIKMLSNVLVINIISYLGSYFSHFFLISNHVNYLKVEQKVRKLSAEAKSNQNVLFSSFPKEVSKKVIAASAKSKDNSLDFDDVLGCVIFCSINNLFFNSEDLHVIKDNLNFIYNIFKYMEKESLRQSITFIKSFSCNCLLVTGLNNHLDKAKSVKNLKKSSHTKSYKEIKMETFERDQEYKDNINVIKFCQKSLNFFFDRSFVKKKRNSEIRFGISIHKGKYSSGFIGNSKLAFDVFSDSLNLAQRLSSYCCLHNIKQVIASEAFSQSLRGEKKRIVSHDIQIDIKGKGMCNASLLRNL